MPAPVSENQPFALPDVVAPPNSHNIHFAGAIDRLGIVVAANPISYADIISVVEQFDEIYWNGCPRPKVCEMTIALREPRSRYAFTLTVTLACRGSATGF